MTPTNTGMNPLQIFKYPVTYALIVVVGAFSGILTWATSRSDASEERCWEEVRKHGEEIKSLRKENTDLYRSLLVSNGIIKQITQTDTLKKEVLQ